jgi:hypothetical protein
MRKEMTDFITEDDLTFEDYSRIRSIQREMRFYQEFTLPENVFIQSAIEKYNNGDYSIILKKPSKSEESIEESFDPFSENIEPISMSASPSESTEEQSNVGRKIYIENTMGEIRWYILVANSEDVDPDNHKISIHCDLGKLIVKAKEGDAIEYKGLEMVLIKITEPILFL